MAPVRSRASASPAMYSAIIRPELPEASAARNGCRPVRSGAIRCERRAPDRLPNGTRASRRPSSASAQLAAWKPPLCSASPPANSGFSAAALISTASTSWSPDSVQASAPATGGRQRRPNGSWRRAGGSAPAVSARSRADTSVMPGSGRASATASANASRLPRSAWKVSAATPSPASSRSHRSAHTSAAVANVAALELISGSASPAPIASRAGPPSSPSPASASPSWASTVRSPVPRPPRSRTVGMRSSASASASATATSGRLPPPAVICASRTSTVARTTSSGSGSPTPPAWLRSSRSACSPRSPVTSTWRLAPTPVVRP